MSRQGDLEDHIRTSCNLIREYEEILRLSSDPKEKARARNAIEEQWSHIDEYLREYLPLCRALGAVVPDDIRQIEAACRARTARAQGEGPATWPSGKRDVEIGGDVNRSIIITGNGNIVTIGSGEPAEKATSPSVSPVPPPASSSDCVSNPFCDRGRIKDPARFFDRERILRDLRQKLAAGDSVSLVGEPQIGKSSVLYYLYLTRAEWLPGVTVHYLDLQRVLDREDLCAEVLERMGQEPGDLRALKRALCHQRLVLLLDEVEKLARPAFGADLHDLLRALAQEKLTLAVASHRPLVEVFPPSSDTSPFHNIFVEERLGPFTPAEAREFLAQRLQGTGVTFTRQEVDRLVMESGGHPARLQQLAYTLFKEKL